jgi:sugar phosphate isomerase/epimerase
MMQRNVEFTLRDVAAIGYKEVEFAGLFDTDLTKIERWLTKYQLTSPSTHISLARVKSDLQGVIREARTLGQTYIIVAWIDEPLRRDAASWRRVAADFNRIGESVQRVGLKFAYHNHDFEFQRLPNGEVGYDILLAECDPKLVLMELDLFWITKAGRDPLTYFEKWPGRFPLVHVKDMAGAGTMVNVGQGHIDWGRIFAKRRIAGIDHFFVEHDNPTSPLDDIKVSYQYMARLGL